MVRMIVVPCSLMRSPQLDVDAGGGFAQDQQARLVNQRPRDHQTALHAAREPPRLGPAVLPDAELLEVALGFLPCDTRGDAVVAGLVDDDLLDRFEGIEIEFLRHRTEQRLGGNEIAVYRMTENRNPALGLVDQPGDDADAGRFARAIGAQQREKIAGLDLQVDAAQRLQATGIGFVQVFDLQC